MGKIADKLKQIRVAIYVRVSTHYQIDKDSLPVQKEELIAYAKYVLNADSYEIFEDAGFSAKNTDRPGFQQMMSRIREGEFSHVLVWKLDRISRNLLDFAAMYDELKRLGVTFVSKNEQFDTSSAMGEAMLKIILVFAELENTIEGLIRFENLGDEYFIYNEERKILIGELTNKTYKIGDKIRIRVIRASKELKEIDFELVN